jgi:hypothetical protein
MSEPRLHITEDADGLLTIDIYAPDHVFSFAVDSLDIINALAGIEHKMACKVLPLTTPPQDEGE